MLKKLEDFDRYIAIAGFKNVRIGDVEEFFRHLRSKLGDLEVQLFDAGLVAGRDHLYFAALNALTAFKNKLNISNSLAVETLLYASAQRQIRRAVEMLGIKSETSQIAVLILSKNHGPIEKALRVISDLTSGEREDGVLELTGEKFGAVKEFFGISDLELEAKLERAGLEKQALESLVIEHVALLVTQR